MINYSKRLRAKLTLCVFISILFHPLTLLETAYQERDYTVICGTERGELIISPFLASTIQSHERKIMENFSHSRSLRWVQRVLSVRGEVYSRRDLPLGRQNLDTFSCLFWHVGEFDFSPTQSIKVFEKKFGESNDCWYTDRREWFRRSRW